MALPRRRSISTRASASVSATLCSAIVSTQSVSHSMRIRASASPRPRVNASSARMTFNSPLTRMQNLRRSREPARAAGQSHFLCLGNAGLYRHVLIGAMAIPACALTASPPHRYAAECGGIVHFPAEHGRESVFAGAGDRCRALGIARLGLGVGALGNLVHLLLALADHVPAAVLLVRLARAVQPARGGKREHSGR